jgi:hypothetical protein
MKWLALLAALASAAPADARCYRYWRFPFPQHCSRGGVSHSLDPARVYKTQPPPALRPAEAPIPEICPRGAEEREYGLCLLRVKIKLGG